MPDSAEGFDKQYKQFLHDYWKAKDKNRDTVFETFRLPSDWFLAVFGVDNGGELNRDYSEQFEYFRYATAKRLLPTSPCIGCIVQITVRLVASVQVSTPSPGTLPAAQRFEIHCITTLYDDRVKVVLGGSDETWMDTFVYVQGAFRFFGKGNSTFFDPARVRLADPCSKSGIQTGGKLIYRVGPVYPEAARENHVEGVVTLSVEVGADGSVKQAKVTNGNPLLAEAAREAALKWRYEPFLQCGKPVDMTTLESIRFAARKDN